MEILDLENISFSYGRKRVLCGVNLKVAEHEIIGILGDNGCGKSTLLGIMAGASKPKGGRLSINGIEVYSDSLHGSGFSGFFGRQRLRRNHTREFKNNIGYVPQGNLLIPELSVRDNLRIYYGTDRLICAAIGDDLLKSFGIGDFINVKAGKLSGGMAKKASIACALAGSPRLLILDEPCAALDMSSKASIREYLRRYGEAGGSVVMTTHDEPDIGLCSRVYILKDCALNEADRLRLMKNYNY